MLNRQDGPTDAAERLADVVSQVTYKPGWKVTLANMPRPTEHYAGSEGLTLIIAATVPDSSGTGDTTNVEHWMAVPPTSWDTPTWERWVLEQLIEVERHEAMEFYRVNGHAPFFPAHGPGRDPYELRRASMDH